MDKIQHQDVIKFLLKKGFTCNDIHANMLAVFGDVPTLSTVQKQAGECRRGRESVEDIPQTGHPATATTGASIDRVPHKDMQDKL